MDITQPKCIKGRVCQRFVALCWNIVDGTAMLHFPISLYSLSILEEAEGNEEELVFR